MQQANVSAQPSRSIILLLAAGAGLSVASLYYCQPVLNLLAASLGVPEQSIGIIPTMTQLGYALGILLLNPLGDRVDRRTAILFKAVALALTLTFAASAISLASAVAASLAIGLAATLAQDIVPAAATLAPAESRGRTVGTVMTGLLLGILLSRVASGMIAERFGWHAVYFVAAAAIAALAVTLHRRLPRFEPTTTLPYGSLLGSMLQLWRRHAALRQTVLAQTILAVGFSAFWSTSALLLHREFGLGSSAAGALGLVGAAGSLAAPLAGRLADRRGPEMVARFGAALTAVAFASMGAAYLLPSNFRLAMLAASAIGFDFGFQATLVSHQTIVYGIEPAARSRANAILFTGMFLGMAAGSSLGSLSFGAFGWLGLTAVSTLAALVALLVRSLPADLQPRFAKVCEQQ